MKNAKPPGTTDEEIRAVVERLARPHRSGGAVIERAAILAEGARSAAILAWIAERAAEPETRPAASISRGLHGTGFGGGGATAARGPARYVLPPGVVAPTRSAQVT